MEAEAISKGTRGPGHACTLALQHSNCWTVANRHFRVWGLNVIAHITTVCSARTLGGNLVFDFAFNPAYGARFSTHRVLECTLQSRMPHPTTFRCRCAC